jgi:hypothetical protein
MKTMAFRLNIARRTLSQAMVPDGPGGAPAPPSVTTTGIVAPNPAILGSPSAVVDNDSLPHGRVDLIRAPGEQDLGSSATAPENWEAARLSVMNNWARRVRFNKKRRAARLARDRAKRS